jgi:hypothetical protein
VKLLKYQFPWLYNQTFLNCYMHADIHNETNIIISVIFHYKHATIGWRKISVIPDFVERLQNTKNGEIIWCCTSSVQLSITYKLHHQIVAQCLHSAPTCFCHLQGTTSLINVYSVYGYLSVMTGRLYIPIKYKRSTMMNKSSTYRGRYVIFFKLVLESRRY